MFGMTLAGEMDRYGVTVNVICPSGLTRMTEDLSADFGSDEQQALKEKQATAHRTNEYVGGSPNNVAPIVSWLCSPDGRDVTDASILSQHNPIRSWHWPGSDGGRSAFSKRSSLSM